MPSRYKSSPSFFAHIYMTLSYDDYVERVHTARWNFKDMKMIGEESVSNTCNNFIKKVKISFLRWKERAKIARGK